ncbi:MAG TPA: hypothetical protein PKZ75_00810 [Bacteroidia bacterium]|nr:hypothetical protein [Bacteroidia bacterium]
MKCYLKIPSLSFMQEFKQHIINACKSHLENKILSLNTIIKEVSESSNSESKSSAGDKHETSKAMMQLEIEKLGTQLKEAELQLSEFEKINFSKTIQTIEQGSLVETNKGYFLIASSIGKITVDDKTIFVISSKSPLAVAFSGKQKENNVSFNGVQYMINAIY